MFRSEFTAYKFRTLAAGIAAALLLSTSAAHAASITHEYSLNGTLADNYGGPALANNGATLGGSGLRFGANQGPSLSGAIDSSTYSIELQFSLNSVSGYKKILDFKDRGSDTGFYNYSSSARFYNVANGAGGAIDAGTSTHIVLTRDDADDQFSAYVDGVLQLSFLDTGNLATFTGTDNIMHFFRDDFATGQSEATSGFVDYIRIYDGELSASEVLSIYEAGDSPEFVVAVPAPAPLALLGIGLLALAGTRRLYA